MYDDIKLTSHTFMKLNCIAVDFVKKERMRSLFLNHY